MLVNLRPVMSEGHRIAAINWIDHMPKTIVTHPDNLEYVRKIFEAKDRSEREKFGDHIWYINPFGINFKTNVHMDREKWTGRWKIKENRFYSWWDGKGEPPSWCIYCGFVEKEMEPLFYEMEDFRTFMNFGWGLSIKDSKQFLMKVGV